MGDLGAILVRSWSTSSVKGVQRGTPGQELTRLTGNGNGEPSRVRRGGWSPCLSMSSRRRRKNLPPSAPVSGSTRAPMRGVQDYWMFDKSTVVLMRYEPDGTQINREAYEGDPAPFIEYQRIAM